MEDTWLGLERVDETTWRLPVVPGVVSGASALFGGCATAAGLAITAEIAPQPVVWASSHFGALARLGSEVLLRASTISIGRTMTHVEVRGEVDGQESFLVRTAAGDRPVVHVEGQWVEPPPAVSTVEACAPFEQPVHAATWAERFEFRLAESPVDPHRPAARWWVRALDPQPGVVTTAAVLADYVTYGVGRALGVPMGGLSIDNVLRLHHAVEAEWFLLEVAPEAIRGGFGHGTARVFAGDVLVATGTQSIVVNGWDWRLPNEREGE